MNMESGTDGEGRVRGKERGVAGVGGMGGGGWPLMVGIGSV